MLIKGRKKSWQRLWQVLRPQGAVRQRFAFQKPTALFLAGADGLSNFSLRAHHMLQSLGVLNGTAGVPTHHEKLYACLHDFSGTLHIQIASIDESFNVANRVECAPGLDVRRDSEQLHLNPGTIGRFKERSKFLYIRCNGLTR
jgi:hypothetical protein